MMILILSLWIVTIGTFQNRGEVSWFFVFGEVKGLSSLNLMTTIAKRGRGHRREQSMSSTWRWLTTMRLGRKRLIMGRWRVTSNLLPLAYILSNLLKNLTCSAVYEVVHVVGQVNHYVSHQQQWAKPSQEILIRLTKQLTWDTHWSRSFLDQDLGRSEKGKFGPKLLFLQASSIMACSNFGAFSANKSFNGDAIALFKRMYFMSNLVTPKVEQVEQKQSTSAVSTHRRANGHSWRQHPVLATK